MTKKSRVRSWGAFCLVLLWLGISAGCQCAKPAPWPCFGYHPTCWQLWPECCPPCPLPEPAAGDFGNSPGNLPAGVAAPYPGNNAEIIPMPNQPLDLSPSQD